MQGIVTKFWKNGHKKRKKPYGFIDGYDGEDYYFQTNGELFNVGDLVSFKGEINEKGNYASHVKACTE